MAIFQGLYRRSSRTNLPPKRGGFGLHGATMGIVFYASFAMLFPNLVGELMRGSVTVICRCVRRGRTYRLMATIEWV